MNRMTDKVTWKPGTLLAPLPVVLVTCLRTDHGANIITVAWVGTVCTEPPLISISIRPERYSHDLIAGAGEFAVNVPAAGMVRAVDYCGVVSGRDVDKFTATQLTPGPAQTMRTPVIQECPLNLECRVKQILPLGSHTLFIGEVMAVQAAASLITGAGRLAMEKAGLIAFAHGHYYSLGRQLGHFGFSVRKSRSPRPSAAPAVRK